MTNDSDYTTKPSPWPVADTVQRLTDAMTAKGVRIFATIDQQAAAREVGLELRETVLIVFGSPKAGTPVMDAIPLAALDLPLKLVVWDDSDQTSVSYLKTVVLIQRHGIPAEMAGPLGAIDVLTDAVLTA